MMFEQYFFLPSKKMFKQSYSNNIDIRKSDYTHIQIYRYTLDSVKNIIKKK